MVCRNYVLSLYYDKERIGPSQCVHELIILPATSVLLCAILANRTLKLFLTNGVSISVFITLVNMNIGIVDSVLLNVSDDRASFRVYGNYRNCNIL